MIIINRAGYTIVLHMSLQLIGVTKPLHTKHIAKSLKSFNVSIEI